MDGVWYLEKYDAHGDRIVSTDTEKLYSKLPQSSSPWYPMLDSDLEILKHMQDDTVQKCYYN